MTVRISYVDDEEWMTVPGALGTVRFETRVSLRELIATVLDGLDDVLRTGLEHYEDCLGPKRFPYIRYGQLREMYLRAGAAQ